MKYITTVLILFILSCRNIPIDKEQLLGDDFRLFQDTPAWDLAKAVDDEDVDEIRRQVLSLNVSVDYKEDKFGETLLMIAVRTNKTKSVKVLLELGADPNEPDDTIHGYGRNSVIYASEFSTPNPQLLKLLLENGGNPNSIERGMQKDNVGNWEPARGFALFYAIFDSFEKVKILVEAGADVNMQTETHKGGSIYAAIVCNRMDILLFLLEHGADCHRKFERFDPDLPSPTYYTDLLYELRCCVYPLNSKEYKEKMKVIRLLKEKGMNYWESPVPNVAISIIKKELSPMTDKEFQEYIKRY